MATFKNHVYVSNPETGDAAWFEPGDEVPDWATEYVDEGNLEGDEEEPQEGEVTGLEDWPALKQEGTANWFETQEAEEASSYEDMKGTELDALLRERNLPTSGTVAEKRQRLEEDDASME